MTKRTVLLIISLALMIGGIGRLVANQAIFRAFHMDHLWLNQPFAWYNYKLLGVLVLWLGIILFVCSRDVIRYRGIIRASILGLLLFFVVSLVAGFAAGLETQYFLVDSIFSLILIVLFLIIQKE
jgi:hypothetical protein